MGDPSDKDGGEPRGLAPGELIAGKFRIERVVGAGGMGLVMEAVNLQLDQRVALKFLRQDVEQSPALVERFAREARAAVKLRSEHVARVSDVGSHPTYGPFMVMELLDGSTLAELLASGAPLPIHRAVEYVIHACEGLAEAHARGIVHQDVKPANLFLATGSDGRASVKVLDFGISKAKLSAPLAETDVTTGRGGAHIGTPHYLSPEQLRAVKDVDHRADIWALGCVLFELVTREKAFRASRFTELVAKILEAPREPVPATTDVPAALIEVIDRCLEKDRTKRYSNTAELALALLPFARRRAHSVTARAVAHVRDGGLAPELTMPSSMPPAPDASNERLSISGLRTPGLPRFDALTPAPPPPTSSSPPAVQTLAPVAPKGSKKGLLLAGALIVCAASAFAVMKLSSEPSSPDGPPSPAASSPSTSKPNPEPSASATGSSPTTEDRAAPSLSAATPATSTRSEGGGASAGAGAKATPPAAHSGAPAPLITTHAPSPPTSAPPRTPESEIRHTR